MVKIKVSYERPEELKQLLARLQPGREDLEGVTEQGRTVSESICGYEMIKMGCVSGAILDKQPAFMCENDT